MTGRHIDSRWSGTSFITADGAGALAQMVREYWHERGYAVGTHVEALTKGPGFAAVFCVRSDLRGGLPVDHPANRQVV